MTAAVQWAGKRVNHLTVIGRGPKNKGSSGRAALWVCICDCGNKRLASAHELRAGTAKTCGDRRCPYRRQMRSRAPVEAGAPIPLTMYEVQELVATPCMLCGMSDPQFGLMVLKVPGRGMTRDNAVMMCRKCRGLYSYSRGLATTPSLARILKHLKEIVNYLYLQGIEITPTLETLPPDITPVPESQL